VTGRYTSYVKPSYGPLLVISGIGLILVGVLSIALGVRSGLAAARGRQAELVTTDRSQPAAADRTHHDAHPAADPDALGHSHDRSRAPWLIMAPILVLLLLAPPALGADAVARNAGSQALIGLKGVAPASGVGSDVGAGGSADGYAPNDGSGHGIGTKAFAKQRPMMAFPALPAGKDPTLTIKDFVMRALYDGADSASNNDITVIGFIAPPGDGYTDGYSLARMTISCCAADASPMRVHLRGPAKYPPDTWVSAVISAQPGTASTDNDYVPAADLTSMTKISQPSDPYEH
jgi:hypothetical protein